jgi:hypothetical protein
VSDSPDRDDETPPERGRTPLGHAREDRVRAGGVQSGDERDRLGFSRRDTAEFTAPDEWSESTPVREERTAYERLQAQVSQHEVRLTAIHGQRGDNGKLKGLSDKIRLILWGASVVIVAAIGGVGAALHAARSSGEESGRLREQVEQSAAAINDLRDLVWDLARNPSPKGIDP